MSILLYLMIAIFAQREIGRNNCGRLEIGWRIFFGLLWPAYVIIFCFAEILSSGGGIRNSTKKLLRWVFLG